MTRYLGLPGRPFARVLSHNNFQTAAGLASSIDVIIRHGLRLHYVSNGQRVPEDLHLPNRAYLLHRAFKDVPELSPHRLDANEPGLMMASAGMVAAGGRRA